GHYLSNFNTSGLVLSLKGMNKIIAISLIALGLVSAGVGVFIWSQGKKPTAALKVESTPPSLVFVDNIQIGQTPVEKFFVSGEVAVKLIPNSTSSALPSYQTKVRLTKETYTIVKREFGETESESAGEIISLEPQSSKTASLAIVTASPDSASITLDGLPQGFTPLLVSSVIPGDHQIVVTAPGFTERVISAKAVAGYKLTINVKLAGQTQVAPTPTPTPTPEPKPSPVAITGSYVTIKDTPTGFLRIRELPSTGSKELGKVYPGDKYKLLSTKSSWYQIRVDLDATNSGWISSQYAEKSD
ncbi:MAG: PEGA domain-containing protein, partial [Candidatus Amesbacteria bacterium]|nr:PEGA domain-containing protein [Candidatus Amesbacteria bacterium]